MAPTMATERAAAEGTVVDPTTPLPTTTVPTATAVEPPPQAAPVNCTAILQAMNATTAEASAEKVDAADDDDSYIRYYYRRCLEASSSMNATELLQTVIGTTTNSSHLLRKENLLPEAGMVSPITDTAGPVRDWSDQFLGQENGGRDDLLRVSIQSAVLIAIFLASVLANSVVFVVFYRRPTLLSNSYRFVLNLAVCNGLMTVLVMPVTLTSTFARRWPLGSGSCEAIGALGVLLFVASILTLLLIAADRYHAIMKPLHYHLTLTSRRSPLCIAAVWTVSLIIATPPLVGWNSFQYQPGKAMCTVTWSSPAPADRAYSFSFVLLCFVVPYFVMLWVYICAFRTAQRTTARARRNSVTPEHAASAATASAADVAAAAVAAGSVGGGLGQKILLGRDRRRSSAASLIHSTTRRRSSTSVTRALLSLHRDDWKAAKTSLIVMSAFTVCWLPFFILITMEAIVGPALDGEVTADGHFRPPGLIIPYWLQGSAICLALAGCALNPLVYVFRSEQIKHEIRRLFCPGSGRRRDRDKEAASTATTTTTNGSQCRRCSVQVPSRRDSPAYTGTGGNCATSTPPLPSGVRTGSASAPTLGGGGEAARMVVTFTEEAKHKDGVCL